MSGHKQAQPAQQGPAVAVNEMGPQQQEPSQQQRDGGIGLWGSCGGRNGPGRQDARGVPCPAGQICARSDGYFWQCLPATPEIVAREQKREEERQALLQQLVRETQAATGRPPQLQELVPVWQLCGGINGPGAADRPGAECEAGAYCNRLDMYSYICQETRRPMGPGPYLPLVKPSPPPALKPEPPIKPVPPTKPGPRGPEESPKLPVAPKEPAPPKGPAAAAPASTPPRVSPKPGTVAPVAPGPGSMVQVQLGFPGTPLGAFEAQYASGVLAAISEVSGAPMSNISSSAASATLPPPEPAPGRRRLAARSLLQAQAAAAAPAAAGDGTVAVYMVPAPDREELLGRFSAALVDNGQGFYAALDRNGVPLRPSISIDGKEVVKAGPPPKNPLATAPAPASEPQAGDAKPPSGRLSTGSIVGIAVGCLGAVVLIPILIFIIVHQSHLKSKAPKYTPQQLNIESVGQLRAKYSQVHGGDAGAGPKDGGPGAGARGPRGRGGLVAAMAAAGIGGGMGSRGTLRDPDDILKRGADQGPAGTVKQPSFMAEVEHQHKRRQWWQTWWQQQQSLWQQTREQWQQEEHGPAGGRGGGRGPARRSSVGDEEEQLRAPTQGGAEEYQQAAGSLQGSEYEQWQKGAASPGLGAAAGRRPELSGAVASKWLAAGDPERVTLLQDGQQRPRKTEAAFHDPPEQKQGLRQLLWGAPAAAAAAGAGAAAGAAAGRDRGSPAAAAALDGVGPGLPVHVASSARQQDQERQWQPTSLGEEEGEAADGWPRHARDRAAATPPGQGSAAGPSGAALVNPFAAGPGLASFPLSAGDDESVDDEPLVGGRGGAAAAIEAPSYGEDEDPYPFETVAYGDLSPGGQDLAVEHAGESFGATGGGNAGVGGSVRSPTPERAREAWERREVLRSPSPNPGDPSIESTMSTQSERIEAAPPSAAPGAASTATATPPAVQQSYFRAFLSGIGAIAGGGAQTPVAAAAAAEAAHPAVLSAARTVSADIDNPWQIHQAGDSDGEGVGKLR